MAKWADIVAAEPAFADAVQRRFDKYRHKVLATLHKDGSPRISGIEAEFRDGELWIAMMPRSFKALDLQRDPRVALHSGTEDPPEPASPGTVFDAKVSGRAAKVVDATTEPEPEERGVRFRIDIDHVVLVTLGDPPDHLLIGRWTEARGITEFKRY